MINHPLLEVAIEASSGLSFTPKNFDRLCKIIPEDLARWILVQNELKHKGLQKFRDAKEMLFTREALEQASHEEVAKYHASLFPINTEVADLCCGIGGDLRALAERGPVLGFDLDEERLKYAFYNLRNVQSQVRWFHADSLQVPWDFKYAYADPSRRVQGQRTNVLKEFTPSPFILKEKMNELCLGIIKLSPMITDHELQKLGGKIQFISYGRECREALVFIGKEVKENFIEAVHVESGEILKNSRELIHQEKPLKYLYEADPAAIRASVLGELCYQFNLKALGSSRGYLTGDEAVYSPWLRGFYVLWSGSYRESKIKEILTSLNGEIDVVKIRGVNLDPIRIKKKFKCKGERLHLIIYSYNFRFLAIVAKNMSIKH